jgi:hypothetical protein
MTGARTCNGKEVVVLYKSVILYTVVALYTVVFTQLLSCTQLFFTQLFYIQLFCTQFSLRLLHSVSKQEPGKENLHDRSAFCVLQAKIFGGPDSIPEQSMLQLYVYMRG